MIPSTEILYRVATLMATTSPLGEGTPVQIILIKAPFTPSPDLLLTAVVEADFDGYLQTKATNGDKLVSADPENGDARIDLQPAAADRFWVVTGNTNLPQTIYGYAVIHTATASLLGSELFPSPVTLTASGQSIFLPRAGFRVKSSWIS